MSYIYIYTYIYIHIYNGIILSHKKDWNAATWMNLEIIILTELSQIKTNIIWYLYVESKLWYKWTYLQNRNRIFCTWLSGFPNTIYGKDYLFPIVYSWLFCHKLIDKYMCQLTYMCKFISGILIHFHLSMFLYQFY